MCLSLEAFPDHMADLGTEGLGSEKESVHGSQPDLRRIADLPVPADFLSLSNDAKPKLMTPDAFMTPSTSLQQVIRDSTVSVMQGVGVDFGAFGHILHLE